MIKIVREDASTPDNHTQDNLFNPNSINLDEDAQVGSVRWNTTYYPFLLRTLGRKTLRLFPSNGT